MKAFLLAAGKGTRLKPITDKIPKCMVPIGGSPLLSIWLNHLENFGIHEVLINTHYFSDIVEKFVKLYKGKIKIKTIYEPELLGSAGTLVNNFDFVSREKIFWVFYADNLTNINLNEMMNFHTEKNSDLTIGLFHTPIPEQSGIASLDDEGRIISFVEKPRHPTSDLANAGIIIASTSILHEVKVNHPFDISYDILPKFIGRMYGYVIQEQLIDVGTIDNFNKAQKVWVTIKNEIYSKKIS